MVEDVVLQTEEPAASEAPAVAPEVNPDQPSNEGEPEREAPPVPEGGLPDGWTMEQWKWYGHQWLEQNQES